MHAAHACKPVSTPQQSTHRAGLYCKLWTDHLEHWRGVQRGQVQRVGPTNRARVCALPSLREGRPQVAAAVSRQADGHRAYGRGADWLGTPLDDRMQGRTGGSERSHLPGKEVVRRCMFQGGIDKMRGFV